MVQVLFGEIHEVGLCFLMDGVMAAGFLFFRSVEMLVINCGKNFTNFCCGLSRSVLCREGLHDVFANFTRELCHKYTFLFLCVRVAFGCVMPCKKSASMQNFAFWT